MRDITDDGFDSAVASGRVVVDFYTDHCPPCKKLREIIDLLEPKITDTTFVKINVGEEMLHASRLMVVAAPTLILFVDGEEVKRYQGVMSASNLKEWIGV